ncbi:MAG TPA: XdhC family protein [Hyphomicrobiales bacterium]|nr:XdhC family protein [Hyphomicrobiales bacterium]
MDLALLKALNEERAARRAAAVVTDLESGDERLVKGDDYAADPLADEIVEGFRTGRSRTVEADGKRYFVTVHVPPAKLVVTGAVHISQAMAPMARQLGYDMTIIDPRSAFATPERFPGGEVLAEWPDTALEKVVLDRFSAFVAVTHDPKIDDPGLIAALNAGCFYIGALGSRKTHGRRLDRLRAAGIGDNALQRIHAPIGLDIGAVSPEEIAVAIFAEITQVRRLVVEKARAPRQPAEATA